MYIKEVYFPLRPKILILNDAIILHLLCEREPAYHESLHGSVIRIQQKARHGANLGRPVPAIRAVNKHAHTFLSHSLRAQKKSEMSQAGRKAMVRDVQRDSTV